MHRYGGNRKGRRGSEGWRAKRKGGEGDKQREIEIYSSMQKKKKNQFKTCEAEKGVHGVNR